MEDIIMIGCGGHAKSVADCIIRQGKYRIVGYTDVEPRPVPWKYLGTDEVLQHWFDSGVKNAVVAIGYLGKGKIREKLYTRLKEIGFSLPVICDPSAIVAESAYVGEGTFVGKGAIINAFAKVGNMAIINTKALVEHDCSVSDFAHIAVAAVLCGQVTVGKGAFIGANATVIQEMDVLSYQTVPAGAVIRR